METVHADQAYEGCRLPGVLGVSRIIKGACVTWVCYLAMLSVARITQRRLLIINTDVRMLTEVKKHSGEKKTVPVSPCPPQMLQGLACH